MESKGRKELSAVFCPTQEHGRDAIPCSTILSVILSWLMARPTYDGPILPETVAAEIALTPMPLEIGPRIPAAPDGTALGSVGVRFQRPNGWTLALNPHKRRRLDPGGWLKPLAVLGCCRRL